MSEHLAHIAVFEDTGRLVQASGAFPDAVTESLRVAWDLGLTTSGARGNHLHAVPILEHYRGRGGAAPASEDEAAHIAAALGWLTHRAADLQMKAIGRQLVAMLGGEERGRIGDFEVWDTEMEVFQDAVVLREVYDGGRIQPGTPYEPLSPATLAPEMAPHPAAAAVNVGEVEPLLAHEIRRGMLTLHSFVDRERDLDAWMDRAIEEGQDFTEDLTTYFFAYQPPAGRTYEHAEKDFFYLDRINWYDAGDEAIRWARALQRGTAQPAVPLQEAVDAARTQSQYAQALYRGYQNVRAAADYLEGRIDKDALYDAVEIFNANHRL